MRLAISPSISAPPALPGLVLQTLHLPVALRATTDVSLELTGGTFNPMAPPFSFLDSTWRQFLAAFGMPLELAMPAAGFYPRGGGKVLARIAPASPTPYVQLNRGPLIKLHGSAGVSNLADNIAQRMQKRAIARLAAEGLKCEIELVRWPGPGQGAAISLIAEHEGTVPATFVGLGERGKPSEAVADDAVDQLLAFEAASRRCRRRSLSRSNLAATGLRARPQRIHRFGSDGAPPYERAHDPSLPGPLDHDRGRPGREPAGKSGHHLGPTLLSAVLTAARRGSLGTGRRPGARQRPLQT